MKNPSEDVLNRYFTDRSTMAEAHQVIEWLGTRKGQQYYNAILDDRIQNTKLGQTKCPDSDQLDGLQQVYLKIEEKNHSQNSINKKKYYWLAAAAVSIIIISVFVFNNTINRNNRVLSTGFGEIKTLDLKDGSKLILNSNSEIQIKDDRKISLKGEAFFIVKHLVDNSPFVVTTNELEVKVLGTEFNVNSRRKETEVILNSGSVQLQMYSNFDTAQLSMIPGDLVSFSETEDTYYKKRVDTETLTSWKNNLLVFDHTMFSKIIVLLEDNYGLEVEVQDMELLELEFTAELPADDVMLLLKLIEKSFHISIIKTKNKVLMKKT